MYALPLVSLSQKRNAAKMGPTSYRVVVLMNYEVATMLVLVALVKSLVLLDTDPWIVGRT